MGKENLRLLQTENLTLKQQRENLCRRYLTQAKIIREIRKNNNDLKKKIGVDLIEGALGPQLKSIKENVSQLIESKKNTSPQTKPPDIDLPAPDPQTNELTNFYSL